MCYTTPMRSSARVGGAVALVALFFGACSSSSPSKPTAVARAAPFTSAELQARIVSKAPSGFVRQADDVGDTGPSDLAKAIRDGESGDGGKDLRAEGFVRGYQRLWIGPSHAQIIVFVNQFKSRVGARRNFARATKGSESRPPPGVRKFPVTFLPAAQTIGAAGTDKNGSVAAIDFTSGVFTVQIVCNGPALPGLQARALSVAETQYRRL